MKEYVTLVEQTISYYILPQSKFFVAANLTITVPDGKKIIYSHIPVKTLQVATNLITMSLPDGKNTVYSCMQFGSPMVKDYLSMVHVILRIANSSLITTKQFYSGVCSMVLTKISAECYDTQIILVRKQETSSGLWTLPAAAV